jgi:hypothetical protein
MGSDSKKWVMLLILYYIGYFFTVYSIIMTQATLHIGQDCLNYDNAQKTQNFDYSKSQVQTKIFNIWDTIYIALGFKVQGLCFTNNMWIFNILFAYLPLIILSLAVLDMGIVAQIIIGGTILISSLGAILSNITGLTGGESVAIVGTIIALIAIIIKILPLVLI